MSIWQVSLGVAGVAAAVGLVLAAGTVWLLLTNPVTVSNAVSDGEITPIVRDLAKVLLDAFRTLLRYL